ncbi:MAG: hypothetical protein AB203_00770 [Parcubacteria bacterium C7867-008]|nr:MAG: hypothetical protein AB203_00770 [Parcubacteria bacterium C7867-008]
MPRITAVEHLRRSHKLAVGPSRIELLDAYFINRDKILKFYSSRENYEQEYPVAMWETRVSGLFSTRNPDQFFILASLAPDTEMQEENPFGIIIAYDVATGRGSWCYAYKSMSLTDLMNQDGIP